MQVSSSPAFGKLHRQNAEADCVMRLLRNSWFTEILLLEIIKHDELLPYSNPWAMVQTYYSIYLAIRAYFLAGNRNIARSHQKTLRTICSDLTSYKNRFPEPWCCVLSGDTQGCNVVLQNSSYSSPLGLSNVLVSPYGNDPWQHFLLFLKTTRQRRIREEIDHWKEGHCRKRVLSQERASIVSGIEPTSIFDALYRIRARSNYEDVDSFAFGNISLDDSYRLHHAMSQIIYYTLFVFEMLVAKLLGRRNFDQEVVKFLSTQSGKPGIFTVNLRWKIMSNYL